jgi:proteic killer suppression protein
MIINYKDQGAKDIFNGEDTKQARKTCPTNLWKIARRKLDQLDFAASLNDLRVPPKNKLEALKGDREGQYSIRINDQYRICFFWSNDGVKDVEIVDYH